MHIKESGEMYLETILTLSKTKSAVHSIDVCEALGVSKPSVSRAVGLLKKGGYLIMQDDASLTLTEKGKTHAEKIFERHSVLKSLLLSLGVSEEIAEEDACRMEHVISDESLNKIKESFK